MARRVLCYPLVRNYKIMTVLLQDVLALLESDVRFPLKIFLTLSRMFEHDDLRYMANTLYLKDYVCWIQSYGGLSLDLKKVANEIRNTVNLDDIKRILDEEWHLSSYEKLLEEEDEDEKDDTSEEESIFTTEDQTSSDEEDDVKEE